MDNISITFSSLTPAQAAFMATAYESCLQSDTAADHTNAPQEASEVQASPAISNDELDSAGVPYHPEFHSANRQQTQKGEWRVRRGADAAKVKAYVDQWKSQKAAPPAAEAAPMQPPAAEAAPTQLPQWNAPTVAVAYSEWYAKFNELLTKGVMNEHFAAAMMKEAGVSAMNEFPTNQDAINKGYAFMVKSDNG